MTAPIALFVYNRLAQAQRTLEALAGNALAGQSELFIFSDGPKREDDQAQIEAVRAAIVNTKGFARVTLIAAPVNLGLSRSIIGGVTRLTGEYGRAVVLEDDIVTSPHFLAFMNDALDKYENDARVAAISGYTPPFDEVFAESFFQRDAECWGWATWKRGWELFNPDGLALLAELKRRNLLRFFDHDGTSAYVQMLRDQIRGKNDSWAIRWRASVILAGKLSLYPGQSLTQNIGFDNSGVHSDNSTQWQVELKRGPVAITDMDVVHSQAGFGAFKRFNRRQGFNSPWQRLKRIVKAILGR